MTIETYLANISRLLKSGNAREHSYRGDLQTLLGSILPDILVTNEPARIACGAPDYVLTRKGIPVGYVEAKDIGVNLADKKFKEQFDRYRRALPNLIITDYLNFHFYKDGEPVTSIALADIHNNEIVAAPESFSQFTALIENFSQKITQSIKSSAELASMMAAKARLMANIIKGALDSDDENATPSGLRDQCVSFKRILIHDIDNSEFADIYAQTIAYGMFAARYHDTSLDSFSRIEAATLIPKSNPFLRNLFQYIAGYDLDSRLVWIVDELVQIFTATNVAAIMQNFGKSTRQEDPVIHFYETFLGEYDPKLRKARGVWYTPEPVVGFIVRSVDEIVKTRFNLPKGLTDSSKVKVMIESGVSDKKGTSIRYETELHRLQILDPAAGTGTFLSHVVRHIYNENFATMPGMWAGYVKEHLIPRLNGFELLMTSYAMAHLKLDMLLTETCQQSLDLPRLRIYLTNSLEEHHPDTGTLFASWLSNEANEANHIKRDAPVMIVMGNPPYSVSSSNRSEWIQGLLQDYKKGLNERNIQPLSDDYIKFIRFGQHYVNKNGEGILAYISNNSFIDGIIHRQMRKSLLESFDEIYILDLHGNSKKKETAPDGGKDENVFDIMQGVSINIFVKTGRGNVGANCIRPPFVGNGNYGGNANKGACHAPLRGRLFHHDLYGRRDLKYETLNQSSLASIPWQELQPKAPEYFFVPKDFGAEEVYKKGFGVNELFSVISSGVQTKRDSLFIDYTKSILSERINKLLSTSLENSFISQFNINDSSSYSLLNKIKNSGFDEKLIKAYSYRPFDTRFIYYDRSLLGRAFYKVIQHLVNIENTGLVITRSNRGLSAGYVFITKQITDLHLLDTAADAMFLCPLYLSFDMETSDLFADTGPVPNLDKTIVQKIAAGLGLTFDVGANCIRPPFAGNGNDVVNGIDGGDANKGACNAPLQKSFFTPLDLLDYIYAVLHSPRYRETYKEFLKIDFPRIPYPTDVAEFWRLVGLGGELRRTHLLDVGATDRSPLQVTYPITGANIVTKPHYTDGRVYINESQYFANVPQSAWEFYIGGYQPAQKWLKDRSGRTLDYDDISHYQKIIAALEGTGRIMKEIDEPSESGRD